MHASARAACSWILPHLGTTPVEIPRATPTGVVLLLHREGTTAERTALVNAVPWHVLLVDVDTARLGDGGDCAATAARLEDVSRRAQRDAGLTRYLRPVVVATSTALPFAAPAMAGAPDTALPAAVSVGARADDLDMSCPETSPGTIATVDSRWRFASSPLTLRVPLEQALAAAAREPARDTTPVERWLRHFDLPLTAAWSSHPRGMLVLLSSARGWRRPDDDLARHLAAAGVHVVGIDALRSFWQRRSPRDVALELQRLTDALASTGLPVFIGGREFGAETMAVAGEMMTPEPQDRRRRARGPWAHGVLRGRAAGTGPAAHEPARLVHALGDRAARSPDALRDACAGLALGTVVRVAVCGRSGHACAHRRRGTGARADDRAIHPQAHAVDSRALTGARAQDLGSATPRKARAAFPLASCGTASTGAGDAHSTR